MRRIKVFIARLVCLPIIWNSTTRRNVRYAIIDFRFQAWFNYILFCVRRIKSNRVLLIEFNYCHGEVMGGILPYIHKLGYKADVLINRTIARQNPFYYNRKFIGRMYKVWPQFEQKFIHSRSMKKYRHILLMTSANYNEYYKESGHVVQRLRAAGLDPIVIEHDFSDIKRFGDEEAMKRGRLITLGKFNWGGVFVNPCLFGAPRRIKKSGLTTFITVGNIESKRKNFQMLIEAIQKLSKIGAKFKVIVIGEGSLDNVPADIAPFINITGRLSFPKMFKQVEHSDFFLPLLDPKCDAHNRYLTTGVTGSAQLIYGFLKIPIIHKKFASFYRFNADNAIVYDDNLIDAMIGTINMNNTEYLQHCNHLQHTVTEIVNESLNNLEGILDENKK